MRVVSFGAERPAAGWAAERLRRAAALRIGLAIPSDAYRLANAEGDFLPGLVVDVYARTTVVRPTVRGMEAALDGLLPALRELLPGNRIYLKRDERAARIEGLRLPGGYLEGEGDGTETIEEGGLNLRVDIAEGQKTGFYLDQRDSRLLTASLARGRRVLNLFAYTGRLRAAGGGRRGRALRLGRELQRRPGAGPGERRAQPVPAGRLAELAAGGRVPFPGEGRQRGAVRADRARPAAFRPAEERAAGRDQGLPAAQPGLPGPAGARRAAALLHLLGGGLRRGPAGADPGGGEGARPAGCRSCATCRPPPTTPSPSRTPRGST